MQCHWAAATLDIYVKRFFLKQQNCVGLSASFSGQPLFFLDIFSGPSAGVHSGIRRA